MNWIKITRVAGIYALCVMVMLLISWWAGIAKGFWIYGGALICCWHDLFGDSRNDFSGNEKAVVFALLFLIASSPIVLNHFDPNLFGWRYSGPVCLSVASVIFAVAALWKNAATGEEKE